MAQFPGYLRPETPAAASYRPGSVLDILGALGPREPSVRRASVRAASAPAVLAVTERRGVAAPSGG